MDNDKLYEGIKALGKRYHFYSQVEGYNFSIEPLLDAEEAIQNVLSK